ncbi:hypothetical protein N7533_012990 [Penicillium manginii]|jgi:light-regulated signal transduction histidine kinase (bacteriophytochrome)|uniref:uncharacterized protein n=1 Tax=Penicillium manginii TaxID=203109 RepID=UPI0025486071|nr:uncharacterized protein N7533_012990 [Penicillium manginii]KAJ5734587.1 hypothetical protein N7533_012990 [Penicillium manginii]
MDLTYSKSPDHLASASSERSRHITTRFNHIITADSHAIITESAEPSVRKCKDEPIHTPGAIQSFGVMLALREESPDQLVVRVVSENCIKLIGYSPAQLFELDSFCDILHDDQAKNLLDQVHFVSEETYNLDLDGPSVFSLTISMWNGEPRSFWCAAHISPTQKDLIVCELEQKDDKAHPLDANEFHTPPIPTATLGVWPTQEQFEASTMKSSQPLQLLRNARHKKGEAEIMEIFSLVAQVQDQLSLANDIDTLLNVALGIVKDLTGFHKVMIYRFDHNWDGFVVAELVDPMATVDLYKGLHFPASDIPPQARELYRVNKVRLLYDRDQITARLVCRTEGDLEMPLNMTHAYLRAMSPVHIKYLANMGVRSSMSISLDGLKGLWGLISCHSYGNNGMRVPFSIRKMCRLVGDTVSRHIQRISDLSQLQMLSLLKALPKEIDSSSYVLASSVDLFQILGADYAVLSIADDMKILGEGSNSHEILAILGFLRLHRFHSIFGSHDIQHDFPEFRYPPGLRTTAGILYISLCMSGRDFLVFLRKGQLVDIEWGGTPDGSEKWDRAASSLEPRSSFAAWKETVLGQSRIWSDADTTTAGIIGFIYSKFIEMRRSKDAALRNLQLTKALLPKFSHDFNTPLDETLKALEIGLDKALDFEAYEKLTDLHASSNSLVYAMNDLLDTDNAREWKILISPPCSEFGLGIKLWYINIVHESCHSLKLDPRRYFFIEWQTYNLKGDAE